MILDRHAPFDLAAIAAHLRPGRSLVFWPNAIDPAHADVNGQSALASAAILNQVLAGNLDERGFVTNEHRYLAIAPSARERDRG